MAKKPRGVVISLRAYAIAAPIMALLVGLYNAGDLSGLALLIVFALMFSSILIAYDALFVPFPFSTLGSLIRTPLPEGEEPLARSHRAWLHHRVIIGAVPIPVNSPFRLVLYPSGLAVHLLGSRAFVEKKYFTEARELSSMPKWYELQHSSSEVKNPIRFGDKDLFHALCLLVESEKNKAL